MNLNKKQAEQFYKLNKKEKEQYIKNIIFNQTKIKYPINEEESKKYQYKYWNTQPVINNKNDMFTSNPIHQILEKVDYTLDNNLKLLVLDNNESNFNKINEFLNFNMNHKNDMFNIVYNDESLTTILGNEKIFVCLQKENNIVGLLGASIKTFRVNDKSQKMADVRILCLDRMFRGKRYSVKLFTFLRNHLVDYNIYNAIYMTNRYIPIPNSSIDLFFRPLNYQKLYKLNLLKKCDKKQFDYNVQKYGLNYSVPNLIKINPQNCNEEKYQNLYSLYNEYMEKFNLYQQLEFNEFCDLLNLNCTYAIVDTSNNIIDFFTFSKSTYKFQKTKLQCARLLMYTNVSVDYTSDQILNFLSKTAFTEEKLDGLFIFNNFDNNMAVSDNDCCYNRTPSFYYINMFNWQFPKINQNQIGFI